MRSNRRDAVANALMPGQVMGKCSLSWSLVMERPYIGAADRVQAQQAAPEAAGLMDVTALVAAGQMPEMLATIEGQPVVLGDYVDLSSQPDIIGQPLADAIAEMPEASGRYYTLERARNN